MITQKGISGTRSQSHSPQFAQPLAIKDLLARDMVQSLASKVGIDLTICPKFSFNRTGLSNTQFDLTLPMATSVDSPDTDREAGLPRQTVGADWLTVYSDKLGLSDSDLEKLCKYIDEIGQASLNRVNEFQLASPHPFMELFTSECKNDFGAFVRYNDLPTGFHQVWVCITGEQFSCLSAFEQFRLSATMARVGNLTRFDAALTDYDKVFSWKEVLEATHSDNFRGFRVSGLPPLKREVGQAYSSPGVNYGCRAGELYVRIYEMRFKHEVAANRVEVEFKGRKARQVGKEILGMWDALRLAGATLDEIESRWASYLPGLVFGAIDFIDRGKRIKANGSLKKCSRLDWWQNFQNLFRGVAHKVRWQKPTPTLLSNEGWLNRQVRNSLAVRFEGLGIEKFVSWCLYQATGIEADRLSPAQNLQIQTLKNLGMAALGLFYNSRPDSRVHDWATSGTAVDTRFADLPLFGLGIP